MRIAFLLPLNAISGGIFFVYEQAKRLRRKGHDAVIFFQDARTPLEILDYPGMTDVPTHHLENSAEGNSNERFGERFDWAIATWWETAYNVDQISARHYGYFVQGDERRFYTPPHRLNRLFVEKTYQENFCFFATTTRLAQMLEHDFNQASTLVPVAIDFELFNSSRASYPKTSKRRILVEGPGTHPIKRIAKAFAVLAHFPDVEVFYVASDGYKEDSWRADRFFKGVPYTKVGMLYASCDVLLKLSSEESFAMPVLEMFASGGTAVVSAFAGHDAYIEDGVNALVVPIDDERAAVEAIKALLTDDELLSGLKQGAGETCRRFSLEESNDRFERALIDCARGPERGRDGLTTLKRYSVAYRDYQTLERERLRDADVVVEVENQFQRVSEQVLAKEQQLQHERHQRTSLEHQLQIKDQQLREKDALVAEKDQHLVVRAKQFEEKDRLLVEKDQQLYQRSVQLEVKDQQLYAKDVQLREKDELLRAQMHELSEQIRARDELIQHQREHIKSFAESGAYRLGRALTWPARKLQGK